MYFDIEFLLIYHSCSFKKESMLIAKCQQRIKQYLGFLEKQCYTTVTALPVEAAETQQIYRSVPQDLEWKPVEMPFLYGKEWTTYWLRTRYAVAEQEEGKELYLHATPQSECLVFLNNTPVSAINLWHEKVKLTDAARSGEQFEIALEMYSGHPYPGASPFDKPSIMVSIAAAFMIPGFKAQYPFTLSTAEILAKNRDVYDLYYDAWVLFELTKQLPENSLRKHRILHDLFYGLSQIHFTADKAELQEQIRQTGRTIKPLLQIQNSSTTPKVYIMGHAHIDHAWLWPIWETHRKAARTFACMSYYAREFPEFRFIQSQPAQLETLKMQYPAIFEEVKQAYQRGQWEPNGGMYVEADCNIPNGESLIRQFLVGRLTTEALLNYRSDTLWLPDVFGYAANLPQILKGCNITYFVTNKMNWNDTTRFPYDTFLWKGIDGTGVNTHFITARKEGYNGKVTPENLADAWQHVQHKEVQCGVILPIGEGDGGGGTIRADLELAKRVRDLEGCPKTRWTTASEALAEIFQEARHLPEWRGELYLELHRGTYTTQAQTKHWNRKLEHALRETEFLATLAMPSVYHQLFKQTGGVPYPTEQLLTQWKVLLIHQFHDIIPGSSIKEVYADAMKSYNAINQELNILQHASHTALCEVFDTAQGENPLICLNSLSWDRNSKVAISGQNLSETSCLTSQGRKHPLQKTKNLESEMEYVAFVDVPAMGGRVYYLDRQGSSLDTPLFQYENPRLETPWYQVQFDAAMRISSLVDKETSKEYVKSDMALNTLQTAEDLPILWDAWDIDVDYQLKLHNEERLIASEAISCGPLFWQVRNRYQIGKASTLVQDIFFYTSHKRIDFVTSVDWREDHQLLKALFPLQISAEKVKCDIQYGHVERNTHTNTLADRAQFEICAHKWIALDDGSFGAALLNDCKYGHDVSGSELRLTLLKSSKAPDSEADMGTHAFTYAFLPYQGAFTVENVVRSAYDLNIPLTVVNAEPKKREKSMFSLFRIDNPNVILATVKKAEGEEALILRLYEASGGEQHATLSTALEVKTAWFTNMLEDTGQTIALEHGKIPLTFRGFEIKTLKFAWE
ncbi:hypothetical protein U27_02237 [Candidatus Vecturithrix granuli]|uniref:Glycoside hydrolase family 38 central domain-containing protein n=1 Tax=Vecturithrix granuli TaxID=1499967 RepID=A0A0S6WA78_VECG1|nr:hypothetical protein U27_02237 [Candidatus Vecturithrix granuli]